MKLREVVAGGFSTILTKGKGFGLREMTNRGEVTGNRRGTNGR